MVIRFHFFNSLSKVIEL